MSERSSLSVEQSEILLSSETDTYVPDNHEYSPVSFATAVSISHITSVVEHTFPVYHFLLFV